MMPQMLVIRKLLRRPFVGLCYPHRFMASSPEDIKSSNFPSLVYTLPYIRVAQLVNRMKAFQTYATAAGSTLGLILYVVDAIPSTTCTTIPIIGCTLCVPFYTLGIVCNNFVGGIFLSKDEKVVKVAHINFWGKRKDTIVEVDDIVPFSEIRASPSEIYFKMERYSQPCNLKLSVKYGNIKNKEQFIKIFGEPKIK